MTLDDFYVELVRTKGAGGTWGFVDLYGQPAIRRQDADAMECPLRAVWLSDQSVISRMPPNLVTAIVAAADGRRGHDAAIRSRLLEIVGLAQ